MKKNIGAKLALYPTPLVVVGTMVNGKPNWTLVGHLGIIGHDRVLEHQTDAEADLAGELGVLPDVAAVKQHMAGRRLQKAVHMLHQRGFAGAGMADEADELTPADRQIDVRKRRVFKRRIRAVDMGKLLYL